MRNEAARALGVFWRGKGMRSLHNLVVFIAAILLLVLGISFHLGAQRPRVLRFSTAKCTLFISSYRGSLHLAAQSANVLPSPPYSVDLSRYGNMTFHQGGRLLGGAT